MEIGTVRLIGNTEFSVINPTQTQMVRVFDAPRQLVWDAYTKPEHIPNWWGSRGSTTTIDKHDCRVGGAWRYVSKDAEGNEYAFRGEFLEVVPPEKLTSTFEFEGMPGNVVTDSFTLEDLGDRTRIVAISTFATPEDLETMAATGMADGANESWDRLAEVLAELQQGK